jgi:hypothetical protein
MIILFLLIILHFVCAELRVVNTTIGEYTAIFLYETNHTEGKFALVYQINKNLYFYKQKRAITTLPVTCQFTRSDKLIISTQGCDAGKQRQDSIQTANCVRDRKEALENALLIENCWYLKAGSSECIIRGCDRSYCLGPPVVIMDNIEEAQTITNETLLRSRFVVLYNGEGMACEIPSIVHIDIVKPTVQVTTNCTDWNNVDFSGTYESTLADPYEEVYSDAFYVFKRLNEKTFHRIILRGFNSNEFRFQLATADGSLAMRVKHEFPNIINPELWHEQFPFVLTNTSCTMKMEINKISLPLQLKPRKVIDRLNYKLNTFPSQYYVKQIANAHWGRLDPFGRLVYPGCAENQFCGGFNTGMTQGLVRSPIRYDVDVNFIKHRATCDDFYGWTSNFRIFNSVGDDGVMQRRMDSLNKLCFSPFYDYSVISEKAIVLLTVARDEKFTQCMDMGGWVVGAAHTHCARMMNPGYCPDPLKWMYHRGYCYYRYSPDLDSVLKSPERDLDDICKTIHSLGKPLRGPIRTEQLFLLRRFMGMPPRDVLYRVLQEARQCFCYRNIATDRAEKYPCSCDTAEFGICRIRVPAVLTKLMAPETSSLFIYGQAGGAWRGQIPDIACSNGFTGKHCVILTCPIGIDVKQLSLDPQYNDQLTIFMSLCTLNGMCNYRDKRSCMCMKYRGPPASIMNDHPLVVHQYHPCACPSLEQPPDDFTYIINNRTYDGPYGVCGGRSRGRCVTEDQTGLAVCICTEARNLDPFAADTIEFAQNGDSCACQTAMQMPLGYVTNEDIKEGICNNNGICCPSGERQSNERVKGQNVVLYGREICTNQVGCVCDNGYSGASCTARVPFNTAEGLLLQRLENDIYIQYPLVRLVQRVRVNVASFIETGVNPICVVTQVRVAATLTSTTATFCTFMPSLGYDQIDEWVCPFNTQGLVVVITTTSILSTCEIKTFDETFPAGGNYTNPYAGRFYDQEFYRSFNTTLRYQSMLYAPKGVTNTDTFCDSNHMGRLCKYAISSKRYSITGTLINIPCGINTEPARGEPIGNQCTCNANPALRFIGNACECSESYVAEQQGFFMCANKGICFKTKFPYGRCEYDVEDIKSDPVYFPYRGIVPRSSVLPLYKIEIRNTSLGLLHLGDERTGFVINNEIWLFSPGQILTIESGSGNFDLCSSRIRYPLNITYTCTEDDNVALPVRGMIQLEIWIFACMNGSCIRNETKLETCESFNSCTDAVYCSRILKNYTTSYKCIGKQTLLPIPNNDDILENKRYEQTWMLCGNATHINDPFTANYFGFVGDVSNPVDRIIDDAFVFSGLPSQFSIINLNSHASVHGKGYGLFDSNLPGLDFNIETWSLQHYKTIASIVGTIRCEILDLFKWDQYILEWIELVKNVQTTQDVQIQGIVESNINPINGSNYFNEANYGLWLTDQPIFTRNSRPGIFVTIPSSPKTTELTDVVFTAPFNIYGIQTIGPTGEVCTSHVKFIQKNEQVKISCFTAFKNIPDYIALKQIYYNSTVFNKTILAQTYLQKSIQFLLWYSDDESFFIQDEQFGLINMTSTNNPINKTAFSFVIANASFLGYWTNLRKQILVDKTFPASKQYLANCPISKQHIIQFNNSNDLKYLKDFYYTHLAPRRCSNDFQCLKFSRKLNKNRCLFDNSIWRGWRQGDSSTYPETGVGDEGGCACYKNAKQGYWTNACMDCQLGYGPKDQSTWLKALSFIQNIQNKQGISVSLINNTEWNTTNINVLEQQVYCRLPYGPTTRSTELCGGRGLVKKQEQINILNNQLAFTMNNEYVEVSACSELIINEEIFVNENRTNGLVYSSLTKQLVVINKRDVYIDGMTKPILECNMNEDFCLLQDGNVMLCRRQIQEDKMGLDIYINNRLFTRERNTFWTFNLYPNDGISL